MAAHSLKDLDMFYVLSRVQKVILHGIPDSTHQI